MNRKTSIAGLAVAATVLSGAVAGIIGGFPAFEGASAGVPVPFTPVVLPAVSDTAQPSAALEADGMVMGASVAARDAARPFQPTFAALVTGETVITTDAQMRSVWETLFDTPYPAQVFDFRDEFVVLMGGGAMHPWFGFDIAAVDRFDATWSDGGPFPTTYIESGLAVAAVTTLPGVKPEPMDPEFKVSAVRIDRTHLAEVLFNRQVFAAP